MVGGAVTAAAWLLLLWPRSPAAAMTTALLVLFAYIPVLAAEFALLAWVTRSNGQTQPTTRALARAWVAESIQMTRIFYWRQPFRSRSVPDHLQAGARRGVVLVHGYLCNRGFWNPWMQQLRAKNHAFVAVNLDPPFEAIDHYVPIIEGAVESVTRATGQPPLLVAHSMGGLVARAWWSAPGNAQRIAGLHTIGTPHAGTWMAKFSGSANGRQMQPNSEWLHSLLHRETPAQRERTVCWYSECDNIVIPAASATLRGADNRRIAAAAHIELAFHHDVITAVMRAAEELPTENSVHRSLNP